MTDQKPEAKPVVIIYLTHGNKNEACLYIIIPAQFVSQKKRLIAIWKPCLS